MLSMPIIVLPWLREYCRESLGYPALATRFKVNNLLHGKSSRSSGSG
jgi:hypothetical protein